MPIPTIRYKGHELRAYVQRTLPLFCDPYAPGPHRYTSVVRIDTIPPGVGTVRRYQAEFQGAYPTTADEAIDRAMQYAMDIVDGKVQTQAL
ncbi:MAG TPA: hypothetical protein VEC35_07795 [Noviherbaspirillum sp.]|nr:hypothetical protein [Noviherbaspirillum sp.]